MLVAVDAIPITDIQPGPTPEKTFVYLDPRRGGESGADGIAGGLAGILHHPFQGQGQQARAVVTVPDVLLEYLAWLNKELGG